MTGFSMVMYVSCVDALEEEEEEEEEGFWGGGVRSWRRRVLYDSVSRGRR